jgi:DnaJ homolog subfamily C member 7
MGQGYLGLGNIEEAENQYKKALELEKTSKQIKEELEKIKSVKIYKKKADEEYEKQNFEQSLKELEKALSLSPHSITLKIFKGELLISLQKFEEAKKFVGEFINASDAGKPELLFILGRAIYYLGDSKEGLKNLADALKLDSDLKKCSEFRKRIQKMEKLKEEGNSLFKENKLEEAYEKYNLAIEVDPINKVIGSKLYCNKAAVAIKMKNYDKAIDDSTKAIDLDTNYTKAYQRRAQCYMELDKWDEALTDLHKAKDLNPEDREIHTTIKKAEKQKKLASRKDYYKILGISKNANEQEIKKAYRKQAALNHPDRFTDETEKQKQDGVFKDIGEAYDVLGDENKKRQYDSGVDLNDMGGGMGGFDMGDMGDIFSMFMGGGGGGGGGRRNQGFNFSFGDGGKKSKKRGFNDFSDFGF